MNDTDWAALLEPVARRLLADRLCRENGGDLRFGRRGSLVVHLRGPQAGTWHDFEDDVSGGTLRLVEHVLHVDRADALRWLEAERLIPPRDEDQAAYQPPPPAPRPRARAPSRSAPLAAAILRASVNADNTPARAYLAARWTWPPEQLGPDQLGPALPADVRWCAARDVPAEAHLPDDAAGVLIYVLRRPGEADFEPAVSLEGLTAAGELLQPKRWRRTYGSKTGRVFTAADRPGGSVVLVEGECDALAVALVTIAGAVRAVGGSAGFRPEGAADDAGRPVALVPDGDSVGAAPLARLVAALPDREVRTLPYRLGDPADWLCDHVTEDAGLIAYRDPDHEDPEGAVWLALLADVGRGADVLHLEPVLPAIEESAEAETPNPPRRRSTTGGSNV